LFCLVPIAWQLLCETHLSKEEVQDFKKAIDKQYYFEFFVDDLPVRGFIGAPDDTSSSNPRYFLFKHHHFKILYNEDRVIFANVSADLRQVQPLGDSDLSVEFSFSVEWIKTEVPYAKRMTLFRDSFFEADLEIHWLSILNSFVLVLLLTGFVILILRRILHSDYDRYSRSTQNSDDDIDDSGWKLVHGDVFRLPPQVTLLSAFCGSGAHLAIMSVVCLGMAILGLIPLGDKGAGYPFFFFFLIFLYFFL
jgi:hypothetical protein